MPSHPSTQDLQQQLLQFIAKIPSDANPYLALADYVRAFIVPNVPFSGLIQLYLLAAMLGLTLLFVASSILIRYFKGLFWVFQVSHSPFLIRPHFSLSWSIVALIMLALFEGYIFECVSLFKGDIKPSLGYWVCCVWIIPFVGGSCAAWSLGVSLLTHVQASSTGGGGGGDSFKRWARISNAGGIFAPIIYLAIIVSLGVVTGGYFKNAISIYLEIDDFLKQQAQRWTVGQPLNVLALTPALPLVNKLEAAQTKLITGWKWTYGAYSFFTALLVAVLMSIAFVYLSSLRRRIQQTAQELRGVEGSRGASQQIRSTYSTLQWTIGAFAVIGAIFVSIASYAAAKPDSLQHSVTAQILVLGPLYAFAVCGLPTSLSLLWRAIEARPSDGGRWGERSATHSGSGGGGGGGVRSRRQQKDIDAVKQYSIELGGRRKEVNVTVDVLVKEEGELEKWESLSNASKF